LGRWARSSRRRFVDDRLAHYYNFLDIFFSLPKGPLKIFYH
jgi:hypothetical protein